MKTYIAAALGFVILFVVTYIVIYESYWYLVAVFGGLTGIILTKTKLLSLAAGIGAAAGTVAYVYAVDGTVGFRQGTELSGIIGIPGGFMPILLITVLIMFALAFLGSLVGSSLEINEKNSEAQ